MRLLHTGDLHLGKLLGRKSRQAEQQAVLDEILAVAQREDVHGILLAGDMFEQRVPTPEVEAMLYRFLLAAQQQQVAVMLVPGNHDAPGRWRALAPLLSRAANVHVFSDLVGPNPDHPEKGGRRIIEIGPQREPLVVAGLPWVPWRAVVTGNALQEGVEQSTYADKVADLLDALADGAPKGLPLVLVAHLLVSQSLVGGGEQRLTLNEVWGIQPARLPEAFDYIALGHVHRPQSVGSLGRLARYCGSPMQLDFGETGWSPEVVIIDIASGQPARARSVPLVSPRPLSVLRGTVDEVIAAASGVADHHLLLHITSDLPLSQVRAAVDPQCPHIVDVRLTRVAVETERAVRLTREGGSAPSTRDLLVRYSTAAKQPLSDEDLNVFEQLLSAPLSGEQG